VVRAAYRARLPVNQRRAYGSRAAILAAAVVLVAALALSPAGATVGRLITRALGVQHARTALFSLPAPGRLLVYGPGGTWTVSVNGANRRLGRWREADWSPHGRYIAVSSGDHLVALNGAGIPQWSMARRDVHGVRWYAPSGYRVAYLSGRQLRVAAGDGTGDHLLAGNVAPVAPAWRPGHPYQLAYVTAHGRLVVRDADSGVVAWSRGLAANARALVWSADGRRLIIRTSREVRVYGTGGDLVLVQHAPAGGVIGDAEPSPDGRRLALVTVAGGEGATLVESLISPRLMTHRVLAGQGLGQVAWSPNGRWLLITWPAADQWVFVRAVGAPRILAVSRISRQFAGGRTDAFPHLAGWCCSSFGASG
jgi:hypothetical protein